MAPSGFRIVEQQYLAALKPSLIRREFNLYSLRFTNLFNTVSGGFMIEKDAQISQLTEDNVVAKVAELMETLDQVKKYNALTGSLKKFVLIVISSVLVFFAIAASVGFLNLVVPLERPQFIVIAILSLFIPIIGIGLGVFLIRKKVSSVKMGDWQPELSNGFPSALKMLLELDWDSTFEEISFGRFSYAIYGLFKTAAYWLVVCFAFGIIGNIISFIVLQQPLFGGPVSGLISLLIVYLVLREDLSKRYRQIRALDSLLWELRWFSNELKRAEF